MSSAHRVHFCSFKLELTGSRFDPQARGVTHVTVNGLTKCIGAQVTCCCHGNRTWPAIRSTAGVCTILWLPNGASITWPNASKVAELRLCSSGDNCRCWAQLIYLLDFQREQRLRCGRWTSEVALSVPLLHSALAQSSRTLGLRVAGRVRPWFGTWEQTEQVRLSTRAR